MIGTENLRIDFDDIDEEQHMEVAAELLVCDTVVEYVAHSKSHESFYLIKIAEQEKEKTVENGFGNIKKRMERLKGVFSEKKFDSDLSLHNTYEAKVCIFLQKVCHSHQCSMSRKKGHSELNNEELLMMINI